MKQSSTEAAHIAASSHAAAEAQWRRAGGHVLRAPSRDLAEASCQTFALLQAASSLDQACDVARARLREINSGDATTGAPSKRTRPSVETKPIADADDDVSDGSALQGGLIAQNVLPGKQRLAVSPGDAAANRAHDGSTRLIAADVLSADECELLIAGGLVCMAGSFTRCGQTTLGLSPALAGRLSAAPAALPDAVPFLYRTVERVRRRVSATFGRPLEQLRLSDATLTRLQPVGPTGESAVESADELAAATASGSLDVGLLRRDQFCYWRPHIDQVSVDEYEISALLYLTRGASPSAAPPTPGTVDIGDGAAEEAADFEGGALVFHDKDADRIVHPTPGLLVSFTSGAANLHAVERVTSGTRFALTMWFTTRRESAAAARAADPTHIAMQQWTAALPDPLPERGASSLPMPPLPQYVAHGGSEAAVHGSLPTIRKLPTREESLASAALCSLPANDPLGRALLLADAGQRVEALSRGLDLPAEQAYAAPRPTIQLDDESSAASSWAAHAQPSPSEVHTLLQSRVVALEALLTTWRRARSELAGPKQVSLSGFTEMAEGGPAQPSNSANDDFSVFD